MSSSTGAVVSSTAATMSSSTGAAVSSTAATMSSSTGDVSSSTSVDLSLVMCAQGYGGSDCTVNIDDCSNSPCLNSGTCLDGINSYICFCIVGYTGETCNIVSSSLSFRSYYNISIIYISNTTIINSNTSIPISIIGTNFDLIIEMTMNNEPILFTIQPYNYNISFNTTNYYLLQFQTTSSITGYQMITFITPYETIKPKLLFVSDNECIQIGEYISDGNGGCLPCPIGGYCPGGGR
jgi:hypothetical protein